MSRLAIIGGTGLTRLPGLAITRTERVQTPYGQPSAELVFGRLHDQELIFLARHGDPHTIPPHKVNYRANLWALRHAEATTVLAVAAVGGIGAELWPGRIVVPDQIIDYTYGRVHSYFEGETEPLTHIDFTWPYTGWVREKILAAAQAANVAVMNGGCYGCTQGPRLETAAEIRRMERDGCDIVGMTGMPEAALARELDLAYACCAVVANWAAGKQAGEITIAEIEANLAVGMADVGAILQHWTQG